MKDHIRQMKMKDLPIVSGLYKDANQFTSKNNILKWTKEDIKEYPRYHLVYEKENILGAISATLHRKGLAVVEDIAVRKEYRNHRIGDKLMKHLLNILKEDGIPRVSLWVHWTDAGAIPFYYRHGFRLKMFRHTHGIKYVPDGEDILILERNLNRR